MSTRMLLSSHYLHDYSDFYLDLMINRRESSDNTRLGADHHQLIMPTISKDCIIVIVCYCYIVH